MHFFKKAFALALLFIAVLVAHLGQTGDLTPQSWANLDAADKPGLKIAIDQYPKCWPPAYPTALYIISRLGVNVHLFNVLCFFGALLILWFFTRTYYPGIPPIIPVMLVALVHGNYFNLHQLTAEALFVFLAAAAMFLLARFKDRPSWYLACILGVISAVAALTRFFFLFWIVPIILFHLTVLNPCRSWRGRITHSLAYAGPIVAGVLPWLLHLYRCTGSFSGMDRTAPRAFPPMISHWSELTDLISNVKFSAKTVFIDFFSLRATAFHNVVEKSDLAQPDTYILVALLVLAILAGIGLVFIMRQQSGAEPSLAPADTDDSPQSLPVQFAAVYFVALITLWTGTNNDPIYTRFLFPAYPFIVLAGVAAFTWVQARAASHLVLIPWYLGACLFMVTNLLNIGLGLANSWRIF